MSDRAIRVHGPLRGVAARPGGAVVSGRIVTGITIGSIIAAVVLLGTLMVLARVPLPQDEQVPT